MKQRHSSTIDHPANSGHENGAGLEVQSGTNLEPAATPLARIWQRKTTIIATLAIVALVAYVFLRFVFLLRQFCKQVEATVNVNRLYVASLVDALRWPYYLIWNGLRSFLKELQ